MPTITDLHLTRKGNFAVYIDGEFLLSVHPDVLVEAGLSIGKEVETEALVELAEQAQLKKTKERAFSLLGYKAYTSEGLRRRLCEKADEQIAAQAVERMEELGLIDDADYAERMTKQLYEYKKFGPMRIRQELRRRGVSAELIEQSLERLAEGETDEATRIRALIERKYPLAWEDEKVRRRAFAAMQRMGYASGEIRRALAVQEWD